MEATTLNLGSALILGLAGSVHCAGMCGPLVLALPRPAGGTATQLFTRACYSTGRLAVYGGLGLLAGIVGRSLALAGLQRWLSLAAGTIILLSLLLPRVAHVPAERAMVRLRAAFRWVLQRRHAVSFLLLGGLNGLLPCGLVYLACAGAAATGSIAGGAAYMLFFGAGTVPMMFGLGMAGTLLPVGFRLRFQRLVPVCLAVVGGLLVLRGLSLGIPYLSPDLTPVGGHCPACH